MDTAPAAAPSAAELLILISPALMSVPPSYVFVPASVRMPVPFLLSRPPAPVMVPAKVVFSLLPPTVIAAAPSETVPPVVPPPESEPMTTLLAFKSSVTPATFASVTAELTPNADTEPARSTLAFTNVGPV